MDPIESNNHNGYELGRIAGSLSALTKELEYMRGQLKLMSESIEGLKIWRSQIMSAAVASSALISVVCYILEFFLRTAWGG